MKIKFFFGISNIRTLISFYLIILSFLILLNSSICTQTDYFEAFKVDYDKVYFLFILINMICEELRIKNFKLKILLA